MFAVGLGGGVTGRRSAYSDMTRTVIAEKGDKLGGRLLVVVGTGSSKTQELDAAAGLTSVPNESQPRPSHRDRDNGPTNQTTIL